MQCPNCGKEALNVNGRYVCLDCGIEITQNGASNNYAQPSQVAPSLENHVSSPDSGQAAASSSEVPDPVPATEPSMAGVQVDYVPSSENAPSSLPEAASQPNAEPVKDYYLDTLNKMASGGTTFPPAAETPNVEPVPNSPTVEPQAPVIPVPAEPATQVPPEAPSTTIPAQPSGFQNDLAEPSGGAPAQPENLSISSSETPESLVSAPLGNDLGEAITASTPTDPTMGENQPPIIIEPVDVLASPASPEQEMSSPAQTTVIPPEAPSQGFQDALSQAVTENPGSVSTPVYQGTMRDIAPTQPEAVATQSQPVAGPASSQFPGATNIPTAESVFGAPAYTGGNEEIYAEKDKKNSMKMILVVIAVIVTLVVAGAIFALLFFLKPGSSGGSGRVDSGKVLEISQQVAGKMDESKNVVSSFDAEYDLTKLTFNESLAEGFVKEPFENYFKTVISEKGYWQFDPSGNSFLEVKKNDILAKRKYIKESNITYVYSEQTKSWVQTAGFSLYNAPYLYPIENKGSIFYSSQIENIEQLSGEEVDGQMYARIRIIHKKDFFEDLLLSLNPELFKDTALTNINTENFSFIAWVDEDDRVLKIEAKGDLGITTANFSGTVSVNSEAGYEYDKSFNITKP